MRFTDTNDGIPIIANGNPIGIVKNINNKGVIECVLWDRFVGKSYVADGFSRGSLDAIHIDCDKCRKDVAAEILKAFTGG